MPVPFSPPLRLFIDKCKFLPTDILHIIIDIPLIFSFNFCHVAWGLTPSHHCFWRLRWIAAQNLQPGMDDLHKFLQLDGNRRRQHSPDLPGSWKNHDFFRRIEAENSCREYSKGMTKRSNHWRVPGSWSLIFYDLRISSFFLPISLSLSLHFAPHKFLY